MITEAKFWTALIVGAVVLAIAVQLTRPETISNLPSHLAETEADIPALVERTLLASPHLTGRKKIVSVDIVSNQGNQPAFWAYATVDFELPAENKSSLNDRAGRKSYRIPIFLSYYGYFIPPTHLPKANEY